MIELGHAAMLLALPVALLAAIVPQAGLARRQTQLMALAPVAAIVQAALLLLAFGVLVYAFVVSDFSVALVAAHSHSDKPLLYKISGAWGQHEGSLLLWALILSLFGAAVALAGGQLPARLRVRVLAVQAAIGAGFLAFLAFLSNPFLRLDTPPFNGDGLNPLLQDPGLAFHPPMLYLGYVGLSVAFSFAIAALLEGRVDAAWARWVRPWTLAAWGFLTAGIALGSWWAYYELGWGGFWFWDPVENASLMPWLAATALLHSAIVVERREALKGWTVLLAILAFSFSLLGTFIVRSGVLNSVHAFASDPARGIYILGFLIFIIGGSLMLYARRAPLLAGGGIFAPISREGALLGNNVLLATLLGTVFIGTLFPLFLEAVTGDKISVGPPYYVVTFVPLAVLLLVILGMGPFLPWKRGNWQKLKPLLRYPALASVALLFALIYVFQPDGAAAFAGLAMGSWVLCTAVANLLIQLRGKTASLRYLPGGVWGMTLAHAGIAIAILGMTGASSFTTEVQTIAATGDRVHVAGFDVDFDSVALVEGPNYQALRAQMTFSQGGKQVTVLQPENRRYDDPPTVTTEAAIYPLWWADIYAVIGEAVGDSGYQLRLYVKPLVSFIWLGAGLMVLGGVASLLDRRLRIGAPRSRARASSVPQEV